MASIWRRALSLAVFATLSTTLALPVQSAAPATEFQPQVGQEGKDVIWVPTPQELVDRMLTMAGVKAGEQVIDLGSGDGRTVITAAKRFGANALGIEYNPEMVELSRRNAAKEGVSDRAQFMRADIFQTDFSKATVLTLYLLPSLNLKLRPTILKMRPGTRVVSHAFSMDDWPADQVERAEGRTAYMWIVPARVEGTWRWDVTGGGPRKYEVTLRQQFQQVEGFARADDKQLQFRNAKLRGDTLTFSLIEATGPDSTVQRDFSGRIVGGKLEGTLKLANGTGESRIIGVRAD